MNFIKPFLGRISVALICALLSSLSAFSQDTPASLLSLANKKVGLSKGMKPEEKVANTKEAIELYLRIPSTWPEATRESAKAYFAAGALEKKLGNAEKAIAHFRSVLNVKNEPAMHANSYLALASIYRKQKDLDLATTTLKRMIAECDTEDKSCAQGRLMLGSLARQQKRYVDAMQCARDVLDKHAKLWRENVDAAQLYLSVLIKCRRWQEAAKEMQELDKKILTRFADSKKLESIKNALAKMSARRMLTPIPIANKS